jgi:decaprenyl-phosphate phosphoribosyltransferase
VTTLVVYAFYVQAKEPTVVVGFNLLWLTILPATFGLLRCILVLEHGLFDDPTELAYRDRSFQVAGLLFVVITTMVMMLGMPEGPLARDSNDRTPTSEQPLSEP